MVLLETTQKIKAISENQAKEIMETFREQAQEKGYVIKKSGYEHKEKKAKGEIIDEAWVVSITQVFGGIWDER